MKSSKFVKVGIFLFVSTFLFFSCAGGAGGVIDELTADGDYYNDGTGNGNGININISGGSGLGWVSNASSSSLLNGGAGGSNANVGANGITDSSLSPEHAVAVNQARVLAQQAGSNNSSYSQALVMLEKVLKEDPGAQEAAELYNVIKRFKELEGIGCESLISKKEAELAKLEKEIADLESKIASQKITVENALEAMNNALEEYNDLVSKYQKKAIELESKNAEINAVAKQLTDLQGQIDNETDPVKKAALQKQYDDLYKTYENLLSEKKTLEDELALLEKQVAAAKEKYETAKKNYEKQVQILEEYIAQYNAKCTQRDELIQLIRDLKAERETLRTYLKNIDYTSTGLGDYSYSMRWIVEENTAPYTAYKDITRFIYERYEKGYGEDCTYALTGYVDGKLYDENNYITMSIEYDKSYDTTVKHSPYYGEDWISYGNGGRATVYSGGNPRYFSSGRLYFDNISGVTPDVCKTESYSQCWSYNSDEAFGSGNINARYPYDYNSVTGAFTFVPVGGNGFVFTEGTAFSANYTSANIKVTFKDRSGNEIPELSKFQYVEHAQLSFSGGSGSPFEVYKARATNAHLRDEAKAMPFPVMDVTLFARADQVRQ